MTLELAQMGVLTLVDRAALGCYCVAFARHAQAEMQLAIEGIVVKSPSGYPIQNPHLAISNKSMELMRSFLVEFGMTPSSRTRVHVTPKSNPENRWQKLARE